MGIRAANEILTGAKIASEVVIRGDLALQLVGLLFFLRFSAVFCLELRQCTEAAQNLCL